MQAVRWCILIGLAWGCSAEAPRAEESPRLRVATFSCDVTPPIGGQPLIWTTPVETVEDPLLAKGIVLEEGKDRWVLCAMDWCGLCNSSHRLFRSKLAEAVKTDVSRVMLQCVHQHTAPYVDGDAQRVLDRTRKPIFYVDLKFLDELSGRLAEAARQSLEKFQQIDQIGFGQAKVDRAASSRRVITPDGKLHVRYSSGGKDPAMRALPEGFIDPYLKTVTLAQAGKAVVRMHYYASHPQSFYGDKRVSADVPGFARQRLQQKESVFQVYFTGCAGDVTFGKYNDGSPQAREELAARLYAAMEAAVAATRLVPISRPQWRSEKFLLPLPADIDQMLPKQLAAVEDPEADPAKRVRAATWVSFAQRRTDPLDAAALRIGPVWLVYLPGEAMLEFQRFAQSLRPNDLVAVAAYGDLGTGYICTEAAFKEGGYEPSASHLAPEAEKVLKQTIRRLLAD